jgi:sn-glycerol 3-phosphate transport system permease protein
MDSADMDMTEGGKARAAITGRTPSQEVAARTYGKTRWGTHIALIIVCIIICLPALYALQVATLTTEESFAVPPVLFPPSDDLINNIRILFISRGFDALIVNTTIVSLAVVVLKTILAMGAGLAFVYFQFPGKWFLFFFVLLTLLLPTEIILQPLFRQVSELGWIASGNSRLALTMPFTASALGAFLFRQHFSNIPREMAEAAQIDGAGSFRFLVAVLIPMSWNIIGAHAMIQFLATWNQYVWPLFVVPEMENQVIQVGVAQSAIVSGQADFGLLMTAGLVASIPPLIMFILLQKQFMSGFAITRDK